MRNEVLILDSAVRIPNSSFLVPPWRDGGKHHQSTGRRGEAKDDEGCAVASGGVEHEPGQ